MTKLADLDIEYKISPRRKSIGLMVTTQGKVVVTLPRGATRDSLARALEKHRAWIERQVAARQAAWGQLKEGEAFFLGQPYRLTAGGGTQGAVSLNGGEIRVPLDDGADLWPHLQAWYREQAFHLLRERVSHWGTGMGLEPGPVALKEWKRRWGECHPDGTLRFNWRLIMCPPAVIDYVVVHELAHLLVLGHRGTKRHGPKKWVGVRTGHRWQGGGVPGFRVEGWGWVRFEAGAGPGPGPGPGDGVGGADRRERGVGAGPLCTGGGGSGGGQGPRSPPGWRRPLFDGHHHGAGQVCGGPGRGRGRGQGRHR